MSIEDKFRESEYIFITVKGQLVYNVDYQSEFFETVTKDKKEAGRIKILYKKILSFIKKKSGEHSLFKLYSYLPQDIADLYEENLMFLKKNLMPNMTLLDALRGYAGQLVILNDTCMSEEELREVLCKTISCPFVIGDIFREDAMDIVEKICPLTKKAILFVCHDRLMKCKNENVTMVDLNIYDKKEMFDGAYCHCASPVISLNRCFASQANRKKLSDARYRFGFSVMGPVLCAYSEYIMKYAKTRGIKQIFPMMRDGYIMNIVLNALFPNDDEICIEPLYVSRKALAGTDFEPFNLNENNIMELKQSKITIGAYLRGLGIEASSFAYSELKFEEAERTNIADETVLEVFRRFLSNLPDEKKEKVHKNNEIVYRYLLRHIQPDDDFVTVDFGFAGTIGGRIQNILKQHRNSGVAHNLLLCGSSRQINEIMKGTVVEAFLYNIGENAEVFGYSSYIYAIIENYMMGAEGTTLGYIYDENGDVVPKIQKDTTVCFEDNQVCHEGILDYVWLYRDLKKRYPDIALQVVSDRDTLRMLLERVLLFPTREEATALGKVLYENDFLGQKTQAIVSERLIEKLKNKRIKDFHFQETGHKKDWISGAHAVVDDMEVFAEILQYVHSDLNTAVMSSAFLATMKSGCDRVAIYGMGEKGKLIIRWLIAVGINVSVIIDNNSFYHGKMYYGIPIVSLENFRQQNESIVICSCTYYDEIKKNLEKKNIQRIINWYEHE